MSDNVNNVESISPSINLDKAVDIINTVDNIKQTNSKSVDNNSPNSDIKTDDIDSTNGSNSDKQNDNIDNPTGKEKGYKNLIPLNDRAKEEQREIQKKGGKARARQMKQRKTAKELLETLLSTNMTDEMITDVLGGSQDLLGDDKTAYNVMLTKMLQVACGGDTKAFVALRDTVGDKPADKQEITADIMTDADRKLIDNIKKRIVNSAPID